MSRIVAEARHQPADRFVRRLLSAAGEHAGVERPADDTTIIVIPAA